MPRRRATDRHTDSAPRHHVGEDRNGVELLDVLMAFHHPTRRWLVELLGVEGPASVGQLARCTGLAPGSVSHHLRTLYRHGFVEPAPELARDTRESWWRATSRELTWDAEDLLEATAGRRVVEAAEVEILRHQLRAVRQWMDARRELPEDWRRAAMSGDNLVAATADQLTQLGARLDAVLAEWVRECRADADRRPDVERRPVRATVRAFPSGPVRPSPQGSARG